MPGCVIDASAALALVLPNQPTAAADAFATAPPVGLIAPAVFAIEVRHAILKLERRRILDVGSADAALVELERGVELAPASDPSGFLRAISLARQEALGMYDALYLDLALERGATLASRDSSLLSAAQRRAVTILDLR